MLHEKGIETFLAVAMSRTLGKAAELLNVTQSTISYNLSELENDMGMVLVDRQKGMKSIKLTPAGEGFLPLALKWQAVSREIANARTPNYAYTLTVGGSESVNCRLLPPVYAAMIDHAPPVYPRIVTEISDMMYQAVESRALDAAIVLHEENTRYVQIEPVFKEGFLVALIPREYVEPTEYIQPGELDLGMEFYIEWSDSFRLWHDHIWDPMKNLRVKIDSIRLATLLMRRAGEWCLIPESARAQFEGEQPNAVFCRLCETPPELVYYKLTHRHPKPSATAALEIFDEALKKHLAELGRKEAAK